MQKESFLSHFSPVKLERYTLPNQMVMAPSAIAPEGILYTPEGNVIIKTPRALETQKIPEIVEQFCQGAENAMQVGYTDYPFPIIPVKELIPTYVKQAWAMGSSIALREFKQFLQS